MIPILPESPDPAVPYANLTPIVDLLLQLGNAAIDDGFTMSQGGWLCRMAESIDMSAILAKFELPDSIHVSIVHDSIHDRFSWCTIEGPGAETARWLPPRAS